MRNSFLVLATALCGAMLGYPVQPLQAGETVDKPGMPFFFFCRSNNDLGNTFYFSTTQHAGADVGRQDLQNAFRSFLATKYKYPNTSGVSCVFAPNGDLQKRTEDTRRQTMDNLRAAHFEVDEVDWKFAK